MKGDIFSNYPEDNDMDDRVNGRAKNGGKQDPKPLPYNPPKGPTAQMQKGPGLHGTNHGSCGTQGKR